MSMASFIALMSTDSLNLLLHPTNASEFSPETVGLVTAELDRREAEQEAYRASEKVRIGYLRCGTQQRRNSDSWTVWATFPPHMTDEEVLERCAWYAYSSGPGREFGHMPFVRRTATRVLVTQYRGLDV